MHIEYHVGSHISNKNGFILQYIDWVAMLRLDAKLDHLSKLLSDILADRINIMINCSTSTMVSVANKISPRV